MEIGLRVEKKKKTERMVNHGVVWWRACPCVAWLYTWDRTGGAAGFDECVSLGGLVVQKKLLNRVNEML